MKILKYCITEYNIRILIESINMAAHDDNKNSNTINKYTIKHCNGQCPKMGCRIYLVEDTLSKNYVTGLILAASIYGDDLWSSYIDIRMNNSKLPEYELFGNQIVSKYENKNDGYCMICIDNDGDKRVLYFDDIEYIHGFRRGLRYLGYCDKWKYNNETDGGIISIIRNDKEIDYKGVFSDWIEYNNDFELESSIKGTEIQNEDSDEDTDEESDEESDEDN